MVRIYRRLITNEGYTGEHAFSIGGNYSNKVFFGATLGISRLKYTGHYEHLEKADYYLDSEFSDFTYVEHFENTGTGISLKIGTIYQTDRGVKNRIAFHSPTLYRINERFMIILLRILPMVVIMNSKMMNWLTTMHLRLLSGHLQVLLTSLRKWPFEPRL